MQAKNLFRKFIMGQTLPCDRSFDEADIVAAIDELDSDVLYKIVKEAQDNHDSEETKYENLGRWGSDFEVNIATGALSAVAKLLEKLQSHPKYTAELGVYLVSRLKLNWNIGVWGAEAFLPKISTVGNFAIRNHHRVIGLSGVDGVVEPSEKNEFLSELGLAWSKHAGKKAFDGFVVHHSDEGISLSKALPDSFNEQGQTVVCLTEAVAKAMKRKYPFVLETLTSSRTGHAYLRQFGSVIYVYGDARLDDDLDCQFSNNTVGFYEDGDEEDNLVSLVANGDWVEETFIRVFEELRSYIPSEVADVSEPEADPLAAALVEKGREFAQSFTNSMAYSMVPTFHENPQQMARSAHMVQAFSAVGLSPTVHPTTDVILTNLGFLFDQDKPVTALRSRLKALNEDLQACDLPLIADVQIHLNTLADEAEGLLNLGSIHTLSEEQFTKALKGALTCSGFDFDQASEDSDYAQEAFCDAIEVSLVLSYSELMPLQACLQIAANLSHNGRAALISGRFPAYQAYANYEEDSGTGGWSWAGFEGNTFIDNAKPESFEDDDEYYDDEETDNDD